MSLKIGFAGSDAIALPVLEALNSSEHDLAVIFTQQDKPTGRGRKITANPVRQWALDHGCLSHQPMCLDEAGMTLWRQTPLDVMVVMAYGKILPQACLDFPRLGCMNIHVSLLPSWRGASPIQHAILSGDTQTGLSFMHMDAGLDTGDILRQHKLDIFPNDTLGSLRERFADLSAQHVVSCLEGWNDGSIIPKSQPTEGSTYAGKITKDQAEVDWYKSASVIERQVRAFNPWPVVFFYHGDHRVRVWQSSVSERPSTAWSPGSVVAIDAQGIHIQCGQGVLCLETMQWPGKTAQPCKDILNRRDHGFVVGTILSRS